MFFKRKLKINSNNVKTDKLDKIPVQEADFGDFDYSAIKFNEFLTDDQEYVQTRARADATNPNLALNDASLSPLGQRMQKDNQTLQMINKTITQNLYFDNPEDIPEDLTIKASYKPSTVQTVPTQNDSTDTNEKKYMSDNTKNYLENQKTKVLLTEDVESMIQNFNKLTSEANAILNNSQRVTKPLVTAELEPTQPEAIIDTPKPITAPIAPTPAAPIKSVASVKKEPIRTIITPDNKTRALFNNADSQNIIDNPTHLHSLLPVSKNKVLLRIRKDDKREI